LHINTGVALEKRNMAIILLAASTGLRSADIAKNKKMLQGVELNPHLHFYLLTYFLERSIIKPYQEQMFYIGVECMRSKNIELMNRIKEFIEDCFESNHRMPTVREIASKMSVAPSVVHRYLVSMAERGMITYSHGRMSTAKIDKMNFQTNNIPVVGSIPCGTPTEIEANIEEYLQLPISLFGDGNMYLLHASGDSMINAGIDDGDLVVIKEQTEAKVGQIVVALDGNNGNTLKTLCYDSKKGCYYLHPENEAYDDIYVDALSIQGVARHVIKKLY